MDQPVAKINFLPQQRVHVLIKFANFQQMRRGFKNKTVI